MMTGKDSMSSRVMMTSNTLAMTWLKTRMRLRGSSHALLKRKSIHWVCAWWSMMMNLARDLVPGLRRMTKSLMILHCWRHSSRARRDAASGTRMAKRWFLQSPIMMCGSFRLSINSSGWISRETGSTWSWSSTSPGSMRSSVFLFQSASSASPSLRSLSSSPGSKYGQLIRTSIWPD